jgi:hypothetical protein
MKFFDSYWWLTFSAATATYLSACLVVIVITNDWRWFNYIIPAGLLAAICNTITATGRIIKSEKK